MTGKLPTIELISQAADEIAKRLGQEEARNFLLYNLKQHYPELIPPESHSTIETLCRSKRFLTPKDIAIELQWFDRDRNPDFRRVNKTLWNMGLQVSEWGIYKPAGDGHRHCAIKLYELKHCNLDDVSILWLPSIVEEIRKYLEEASRGA